MTAADQTAAPMPDVSIRARPPSPKRLSRKVLLAGTLAAGAVIALALVTGLSTTQRHASTESQATPASGGPPESIAQASSQYDASTLPRAHVIQPVDLSTDPNASVLTPPQDPTWANGASSSAAGQGGQAVARSAPDPQTVARTSPILFGAANEAGGRAHLGNAVANDEATLDATLIAPHSPFVIQAGDVIPAALVTGLNSDLPGRIIAQVTAPVYDSVTGDHLLIPQGSRLLGAYDNATHYGDHRILLVWDRLILPNGWSINLHQMTGADPSGASGLSDTTDNHLGRLSGAIGLSAIISVIANNSEGNQRNNDTSLGQSVGEAAAQQAAQTGGRIVDRELTVHPTLRVRPGASVRVLVTRDIQLRPYR